MWNNYNEYSFPDILVFSFAFVPFYAFHKAWTSHLFTASPKLTKSCVIKPCVAFSYVILLSVLYPPFIDFTFHLLFPNQPVRLPCNGVLLNTCQAEPSPNIFFFHFLSLAFSPILHPVCSRRSPLPVYLSRLVHLPHFFAEFTTGQVINYVVIWAHTMMNWGLTTLPSDCVCTASSRLPLTVSAEEM